MQLCIKTQLVQPCLQLPVIHQCKDPFSSDHFLQEPAQELCCECIYDTKCVCEGNIMCQTFVFYIIQIFFICLGQTYLYTMCRIQKKNTYIHLYLQVSQSDVISCTGKTWQTSQHPQPPGADSANVPTQEFWTSDRKQAQLSQGHYKSASPLTPSLPPTPKK